MLLVDGDGSSLDIWRESVSLAADTTYTFSYYATSPDGDTLSGSNIADLEILVNGTAQSDTLITSQGGSPSWQLVSTDFTTGAAGSYAFSIKISIPLPMTTTLRLTTFNLSRRSLPHGRS